MACVFPHKYLFKGDLMFCLQVDQEVQVRREDADCPRKSDLKPLWPRDWRLFLETFSDFFQSSQIWAEVALFWLFPHQIWLCFHSLVRNTRNRWNSESRALVPIIPCWMWKLWAKQRKAAKTWKLHESVCDININFACVCPCVCARLDVGQWTVLSLLCFHGDVWKYQWVRGQRSGYLAQ